MPIPAGYRDTLLAPHTHRRVEATWTFTAPCDGTALVLPDGRCDIILRDHMDGACSRRNSHRDVPKPVVTPVLTGPATRAYAITYRAGDRWRGLRLRPGRGAFIWGDTLAHRRDQVLRGDAAGHALPALGDVLAAHDPLAALAEWAHSAPAPADPGTPNLGATLDRLHASGGRLAVADLAQHVGCTPRHLARVFQQRVGIGPKTYGQIVQFHRALRLIRRQGLGLGAASAEAGYADQSHMTRAFRRFGGFAPSRMPLDLALPTLVSA